MRIDADIRINYANEEEKNKIEKLFQDSDGQLMPFLSSMIFPSQLRFSTNLSIDKPFEYKGYNLSFGIIGVES